MTSIRYGPATASLPDGRVLIAGGYDNTEDVATAEVFNPSSGTFSPVGSMSEPRELTATAPLPDGRVLVAGGYDNGDPIATSDIFNPQTNSFSLGPSLPATRYDAATAVVSGGRVMIAGGSDDGVENLSSALVFDPSSATFTGTSSLPAGNFGPAGASLPGGRALVAGGFDDALQDYSTTALAFDPATNSFSSAGIGALAHKRYEAAAVELADGRVLVAGGYTDDALDSAEILSVPSNSFKSKLKGRKVKFSVSTEGTASTTDVSTKVATTAKKKKKKKPKLVKTVSKHGGPGTIVVKIRLTKQGNAKLRQKGKLRVRVVYTPDGGVAATKKLKLTSGK
jgi:hypothetical protein